MQDFRKETDDILALSRNKPNANARKLIDQALLSKWEGIQSAAVQVLGVWGDAESRDTLRRFLAEIADREYGWSIRGVVVSSMAKCVEAEDANWLLDYYFSAPGILAKHELLRAVVKLPPDSARERLIAESGSSDRENRQAALKAIGNMPFTDRVELLKKFVRDNDKEIRNAAMILMRD